MNHNEVEMENDMPVLSDDMFDEEELSIIYGTIRKKENPINPENGNEPYIEGLLLDNDIMTEKETES